MNLVSTTIKTFDNKLMVVPNSKIWSDVITNVTAVTQRRVDMEFGIGYGDDIDLAQQILEEIVAAHPKVLEDPPPVIRMSALADSSVNFICRPWAAGPKGPLSPGFKSRGDEGPHDDGGLDTQGTVA